MKNDANNSSQSAEGLSALTPFVFDGNVDKLREALKDIGPAFILISHVNLKPPVTVPCYIRYTAIDELLLRYGGPEGGHLRVIDIGWSYKTPEKTFSESDFKTLMKKYLSDSPEED